MAEPKCSSKCPDMLVCAKCGEKQCQMGIQGVICGTKKRMDTIRGKGLCCHKCVTLAINMMGRKS